MSNTNETENKTWLERHGWKVAAGLGVAMIGGGLCYLKKKTGVKIPTVKEFIHRNDIEKPATDLAENLMDLWKENDAVNVIASGININDIGKFTTNLADYLKDKDPEFNFDMVDVGVMSLYKKEA